VEGLIGSELLDWMPFGVALFDADGICVRANAVLESVASASAPLAGRSVRDVVHACFGDERAPQVCEDFTLVLRDGEPGSRRECTGANGLHYDCVWQRCDHGGVVAALGVVDVTTHFLRREQLEEQARAAAVLTEIETTLGYTTDFDDILAALTADAPEGARCSSAVAFAWSSDGWVVRHVRGMPRALVRESFATAEIPFAEAALAQRGPIRGRPMDAHGPWGEDDVLVVPFAASGEIGALLLLFGREESFSASALEFAEKLSTVASFALENARLQAAERETREALQTALLGVVADVPGIRFGHLYRSATRHAQVGGDFYELFDLGHEHVGVLMGDVSGKGLPAASLAALVKTTVKIHARALGSPAAVLTLTNDVLLDECDSSSFVTAFYGVLHRATGDMRYCVAGHPPAVLRRPNGTTLLGGGSPILGAYPGLCFEDHHTSMDNGDVLLLYTDGVTEARRQREQYGQERLEALVAGLPSVDARELPEIVFEDVFAFVRGALTDDMAILALSPLQVGAERMQQRLPL
jgi:serine phosphatase RsbU (regulator of sigma subunit)